MITNLSANREIKDYEKEDAFDFKIKADAIRYFLEDNPNSLEQNKMLALYGNWGSGKTSLMRHIEKEINKDIYFPLFFEAWAHEKDENLALSLCDALTTELTDHDVSGKIKKFRVAAINLLKGFTSAISVKVGGPLAGSEINFDGGKLVDSLDKVKGEKKDHSFFIENKEFKESFIEIEELLLKKKDATRIIVFVDDLDRCEPENVLNLITALKLFFTYGEHTIFFAGLDKEAVTKAVRTKYQDVIKSEEYLEKVFDITFGMPKTFSLKNYLSKFFYAKKDNLNDIEGKNIEVIQDFFQSIQFTNPRHIKKIFNKYEILCSFKLSASIPKEIRDYVPALIFQDEQGTLFESIFCLYFIILYENFLEDFEKLEEYNKKLNGYIDPWYNTARVSNSSYSLETASSTLNSYTIRNITDLNLTQLLASAVPGPSKRSFFKFLMIFTDNNISRWSPLNDKDLNQFHNYFPTNGILNRFCNFLIEHKEKLENETVSTYIFWNYFKMAKYLL